MEPGWHIPDLGARLHLPQPSPVEEWARIESRGLHGAEDLLCRLRNTGHRRQVVRRRAAVRRMLLLSTATAALLAGWLFG
jgi:hypothetical protein